MDGIKSLWPIGDNFQGTEKLFNFLIHQNQLLYTQTNEAVKATLCEKRVPNDVVFTPLMNQLKKASEAVHFDSTPLVRNASELYSKKKYEYFISDAQGYYELPLFDLECNDVFPVFLEIEETIAQEANVAQKNKIDSFIQFQELFKGILSTTKVTYIINKLIQRSRSSIHEKQDVFRRNNIVQGRIALADALIHIDELEQIEREFCESRGSEAKIIVITNNLTCDYDKFLDEIVQNIEKGVTYYYVIPEMLEKSIEFIKNTVFEKTNLQGVDKNRFTIVANTDLFTICPRKYTVVIYDRGHLAHFDMDSLRIFCCAQDSYEQSKLYYFEMSHESAISYKQKIIDSIRFES